MEMQSSDLLNDVKGSDSPMRSSPKLQPLQINGSVSNLSIQSMGSMSEPNTPRDFKEALRLMGWYSEPGSPKSSRQASAVALQEPLSTAALNQKLHEQSLASPRKSSPAPGSIFSKPTRGSSEEANAEASFERRNAPGGSSEPSTPRDFLQALRRNDLHAEVAAPMVDKHASGTHGQEPHSGGSRPKTRVNPGSEFAHGPRPHQKMNPGSEFSTPRKGVPEEPHAGILPSDQDTPGAIFQRTGPGASLGSQTTAASLESCLLSPGPLPGTPRLGPSIPAANVPILFRVPT